MPDVTFRTQAETQPIKEAELIPGKVDTAETDGTEAHMKDTGDSSLEVWESENNRKYGVDYFNIRHVAHEFPLKAQFGAVDKYIKQLLTERGYEKNTENYKKVIQEIESEIGSVDLETYKRMQKLFNYIQVMKKYKDIEAKRKQFLTKVDGVHKDNLS